MLVRVVGTASPIQHVWHVDAKGYLEFVAAGNKKFLAPARWRQDQRLDVAMRGINRASPEYEEYRGRCALWSSW